MLNKKYISKKIETLILLIIFVITIFSIPIYYQNKYKNDNHISTLEETDKYFEIKSRYSNYQIIGNANISPQIFSKNDKRININLAPIEPDYSHYLIKKFKDKYLNSENKILIKDIIDLINYQQKQIDYQREQIKNYQRKELDKNDEVNIKNIRSSYSENDMVDNFRSKNKSSTNNPNNDKKQSSAESTRKIPRGIGGIGSQEILSSDSLDNKKISIKEKISEVSFLQSVIRHTNFLFLFSIFVVCLGVIVTHKFKNNKFVTMSEFFLIVITVSTCFTSSNHLFFTVPNFADEIPTFDLAIFALGPIAVIWLSIKGIIDLLYPKNSFVKKRP